jgi:acetyltransferase-like isoleucine patch superfamily enzyme
MLYKFIGILYTIILKLIYFKRLKLKGFILPEGFITIKIAKGGKLIINGNISLRQGSQILVRENALCIIGNKVFFNRNCSVVCREQIIIEDNVLMGESVKIYDNDHLIDGYNVFRDKFTCSKVLVGKNVWIGNDVNILKGSTIFKNSIIGSMSLVKSNLLKSGIYVGIPVKLLKEHNIK